MSCRFLLGWLVCLGALCACGADAPPRAPLGTFLLDVDQMTKALTAQGIPESAARRKATGGRVQLVFDPSGTFTLMVLGEAGQPERFTGGFTRSGNDVVFRTLTRDGQPLDPPLTLGGRLEAGLLVLRGPAGGQVPFILRPK